MPPFYAEHNILSTVDVIVATTDGVPFGVLEVDSESSDAFDEFDVDFLTGFANILAEAVATAARGEHLQKTVLRMQELVAEKEVLSQELKHRVRNSLHLVYGLLTAELFREHSEASIVAFRSIGLRVMGLAEVFDHLLGVGMNKIINFGSYVQSLCASLPELYHAENVKLTCSAEPLTVELDDATALGIIVTELVDNAYQHAFSDRGGEIHVTLDLMPGGLVLTVSDNGAGFVEVETTRRGIGLVRRLVKQVGGDIIQKAGNPGTTWTIMLAAHNAVAEAT